MLSIRKHNQMLWLLSLFILAACSDTSSNGASGPVQLTGSLSRDEIILRVADGSFIGMPEASLAGLCGTPTTTDKYPDVEYKLVIGVCDGYGPAYQWLLVDIEAGTVVDARLDCD